MKLFKGPLKKNDGVEFESQEPSEKLYFMLRRHPITNLGWILASIIMALAPLVAMSIAVDLQINFFDLVPPEYQVLAILLWYMFTMLIAFESFLIWYFNVYIITDKRLIDVDFTGFWGKRISEASYDNVEDISYSTDKFWHILFNYGDIFMQTAAEQTEFEFHSVPKPGLVHDKLTDLVERYKNRPNK